MIVVARRLWSQRKVRQNAWGQEWRELVIETGPWVVRQWPTVMKTFIQAALAPERYRRLGLRLALALAILLWAVLPTSLAAQSAPSPLGVAARARPSASEPSAGAAGVPESRILKIIHGWPDEPTAQDGLIRSLSAQGFGGVVCNVSFAEYLENHQHWTAFERAVAEAKKAGFSLWLYDEKGYPSAAAGGIVLRDHPEWQARGLLVADDEGEGSPLTLKVPPGQPFLIAGFPVRHGEMDLDGATNLSSQVRDGVLSWPPPPGRWRALAITESPLFDGTHVSVSLGDHIPYPNLLQREPTARFIEVTHHRYAQHLGDDLGKWFVSTFTDEPSLMSLFLKRMPYRVLPWAPNLPIEFRKRRGYALEPLVPTLIAEAGAKGRRARYDFWKTVGELVSENYFGQIQEWCAQHHLRSGGHLLMEENPVNQVALYGDFFACFRRMDAPGIDCLTSIPQQVPWYIARLAGSAADLQGRPVTMCETSDHSQRYRPPGDQRPVRNVTTEEIRGTCNRLIVNGIDTITSYYSFAGLTDIQISQLNQWVGRCCSAVKGGCQVADVAVLYPTESLWPRYTPSRLYSTDAPAAARIESIYHDVIETLFAAGRDFTFVDARALTEAQVTNSALANGAFRWRVVILPGADTLPLAAWRNLQHLVEAGGVLVAIGLLPANSESEFPSARVQAVAETIFGSPKAEPHAYGNLAGGGGLLLSPGQISALPAALDRILEPDFKVSAVDSPLRYTHRHLDGREVYFVINDSSHAWQGTVSTAATGPGDCCDPANGEIRPLPRSAHIPLDLPPFGAAILHFAAARPPRQFKLQTGPALGFEGCNLPEATPTVARGEFVREQIEADLSHSAPGRPAWRITGALTRGEVDTHLFTRFIYPHPLDLKGARNLLVDTWVAPTQHTPAELLIILHETNGADYLASSGRWLGVEGHDQTCVPLSRFQLAGWSRDEKGHLDPADITEVRIGWGGYFGAEGERVEFSVALPQVAAGR